MRKQKLVSNNIYHVYNRGVEKRDIFIDDRDYLRFISDMGLFNDIHPAYNIGFKLRQSAIDVGHQYTCCENKLVDILAFCLMPNHYHLLLKQKIEDGISKFMKKLGGGYVNYFNVKYQRVGTLFQGKFKSVLMENTSQLLYIPHYIHLNPLDKFMPEWREKKINNKKGAVNFLNSYKWSSYSDYAGKSKFKDILEKDILSEYFGGPDEYAKDLNNFIGDMDLSGISDLVLE